MALSTPWAASASATSIVCQAGCALDAGAPESDGGLATVLVMRYSLPSTPASIDFGYNVATPLRLHVPLGSLPLPQFDLFAG